MFAINRREFLRTSLAAGAGISLASGPTRAAEETITVYNGQHRALTEAVSTAFTQSTGIKVILRHGESPQLANQIIEEGARSPADIFFSEQSPPIAALDERGMLAATESATLQQIPAGYVSQNKTWIGTSMRCRVIAYNKAMVTESALPASIMDVATPAWKDKVGYVVRDGFQEQVMAIVTLKGRDAALAWLKGLKQYGRLYNGNGAAAKAVEAGEIAMALVNNYYWFGVAREVGADKMKSALHYVSKGDPGALVNLSPAGMLKTAKNSAAAQKYLAFLVSEEGQKAIVNTYAEYPVRPGIVSPFALKPLADIGSVVTPANIGTAQLSYDLQKEAGLL